MKTSKYIWKQLASYVTLGGFSMACSRQIMGGQKISKKMETACSSASKSGSSEVVVSNDFSSDTLNALGPEQSFQIFLLILQKIRLKI